MTQEYKNSAIEALSRHGMLQSSLQTLPGQIARLEQELTAPAVSGLRETVVRSSPGAGEDRLTLGLARKMRMERSLTLARQAVDAVEIALEALTEREQLVLRQFYIRREAGHMDRLCRELGMEEASVYRLKNKALEKFVLAMYGPAGEEGLPS